MITTARYAGRIAALDIARGLAILGMFVAHVGPDRGGLPGWLMAVADGTTNIMVRRQVHKGAHAMITTKDKNKDIDTRGEAETLNRMPETTSRPSWRQMQ